MSEKVRVTIYSKPGCCLCDEAKHAILTSPCRDAVEVEEINIEDDDELMARYGYDIPVIFINGRKAFKHRVTAQEFCARLRRHLLLKKFHINF